MLAGIVTKFLSLIFLCSSVFGAASSQAPESETVQKFVSWVNGRSVHEFCAQVMGKTYVGGDDTLKMPVLNVEYRWYSELVLMKQFSEVTGCIRFELDLKNQPESLMRSEEVTFGAFVSIDKEKTLTFSTNQDKMLVKLMLPEEKMHDLMNPQPVMPRSFSATSIESIDGTVSEIKEIKKQKSGSRLKRFFKRRPSHS